MIKYIKLVWEKLLCLNIFLDFKTLQEQDTKKIRDQILATRVYLFLFFFIGLIFVSANGLTTKLISITIIEPSLETYDRLYAAYPNTISCSCKTIIIPYSIFMSMSFVQHPVCTSELISSKWIDSLFNENTSRLTPLDFRLTVAGQFRLLKSLCSAIAVGVSIFGKDSLDYPLISTKIVSRSSLDSQTSAAIAKFNAIVQTSSIANSGPQYITSLIKQARIVSAVHTNGFLLSTPYSNKYEIINNFYPRYDNASYNENTINTDFNLCGPQSAPTYKAGIYDWNAEVRSYSEIMNPSPSPVFTVPGMNVGCLPYDALSPSSLECFFSSACLNMTARWISTLTASDWPKSLDSSKMLKFSVNSTIGAIIDEQTIDQWITAVNFTAYYETCAPTECTYTYFGNENFLYIMTLLISLFGGLKIALNIIAPLIIRVYRYITQKFSKSKKIIAPSTSTSTNQNTVTTDEDTKQSINTQLTKLIKQIINYILTFNLFEEDIDNPRLGIYTTYVYIISMIVSVVTIVFYSSLAIQTNLITVQTPSLSTFETLQAIYSKTLNCPCSELAIYHSDMFDFPNPTYHEICASVFLTEDWLDGYFTINFVNESDRRPLPDTDFRQNGILLFNSLKSVCEFSHNAVDKFTALFLIEQFVDTNALPRLEFELNANLALAEFQYTMQETWRSFMSVGRTLWTASEYENANNLQVVNISGKVQLQRYIAPPSGYNACACSVARHCPNSSWSGAPFVCYYGNNCTNGSIIWSMPGLVKSCSIIDSLFNSDLRCFFNKTCLDTFLLMYNVDMPKRLPLPSTIRNVSTLNSSALVSFKTTDTLDTIASKMMIAKWDIRTNYTGYYSSCAPAKCTYTITRRMDLLYIFTMITTYFGGLAVTFRLLIPIFMRFLYWLFIYRSNVAESSSGFLHWFTALKINIKRLLTTMNHFKKESLLSQLSNAQMTSLKASRIYVVLLTASVFIILIFNAFYRLDITKTVKSPSLATVDQLQAMYPSTFSCTCENLAISFNTYGSINATMHQVCSSDIIRQSWITHLYGFNDSINTYQKLHRPLLSKQLQVLQWLCEEGQALIDHWIFAYSNKVMLNTHLFTRLFFKSYVNNIINDLNSRAPTYFQIMIPLLTEILESSLLPTAFNTDWTIEYGNELNGYITQSRPRFYMNNTCNCVVSKSCQDYLRIGSDDLITPGLVIGCTPIEGLRMSTLECFYSSDCISTIINHLEYYLQIDGSPPPNFSLPTNQSITIRPLNDSIESRFRSNDTMEFLFNEMLIEEWIITTSYEKYFAACMISECQYKYTRRQDILHVVLSLLALYGGLAVGWRLIVWNGLMLYQWIKRRYFISSTIVQPFSTTV